MTGRVVLVTGAARGLGLGVAARLAADGCRVVLVDVDEAVHEAAAALDPAGSGFGVVADVSVEADCERAVAAAVGRFGRLDGLVNNAGIGGPSTAVHETDPAVFRRVLEVNLVGPFLMARAAVPHLRASEPGAGIVNITSILGQRAEAGGGAYSASKAGLALLGQAMALELAPHGIRVNSVAPGNMLTEMHREHLAGLAARDGVTLEQATRSVRDSVPLGRHGHGADIGAAVSWLLSADAGYVTGQTVGVNGGVVLS